MNWTYENEADTATKARVLSIAQEEFEAALAEREKFAQLLQPLLAGNKDAALAAVRNAAPLIGFLLPLLSETQRSMIALPVVDCMKDER